MPHVLLVIVSAFLGKFVVLGSFLFGSVVAWKISPYLGVPLTGEVIQATSVGIYLSLLFALNIKFYPSRAERRLLKSFVLAAVPSGIFLALLPLEFDWTLYLLDFGAWLTGYQVILTYYRRATCDPLY